MTYLSCPIGSGSQHRWRGRPLPHRSREDAPKGQQVADEVDAEVDVAGDGQVAQVAEVRVHAAAAHGDGCALLGAELQAAQRRGDRFVCNDPRHLRPRGERRQNCAMPDKGNDMQPMGC